MIVRSRIRERNEGSEGQTLREYKRAKRIRERTQRPSKRVQTSSEVEGEAEIKKA